jgi:hypothetical protein
MGQLESLRELSNKKKKKIEINKPWLLCLMGSLMNFECRSMHDLRLVLKSHNYVLNSLSLELISVMSHNAMFIA